MRASHLNKALANTSSIQLGDKMSESKELLHKWDGWLRSHKNNHYEAAKKYTAYHQLTGIPLVVLTAIINAGIWLLLIKEFSDHEFILNLAIATLSLIVSCLAAVQAFSGFDKKSEQHKNAAVKYSALNGKVEILLNRNGDIDEAELAKLSEEWGLITENAPPL